MWILYGMIRGKTIFWCRRRDSNSHDLSHNHLKVACLPIPPRRHLTELALSDFDYFGISFEFAGAACGAGVTAGADSTGMALVVSITLALALTTLPEPSLWLAM